MYPACTTNSSIVKHFQRILDDDASGEETSSHRVLLDGDGVETRRGWLQSWW